jgi:hypothetical protein
MIAYRDIYKAIFQPDITGNDDVLYDDYEEILDEQIIHFINHGRRLPKEYIMSKKNDRYNKRSGETSSRNN